QEATHAGRAEALTQLARVEGLRGNFEQCARLLDRAERLAGSSPAANVRLELERGRMCRSSGDPEAAFPLFQDAFARAAEARERDAENDAAVAFAKYCAGATLRVRGRPHEALAMLEPAVSWARQAGNPDPEYERELAAAQAALVPPTG